jgi:hypothetical protein
LGLSTTATSQEAVYAYVIYAPGRHTHLMFDPECPY